MSTLRSAERGCGAGWMTLLRGVVVLVEVEALEREACGVLFRARLSVLGVVVDLFFVPDDFLVLLVVVLRAITILLTFHWSSNYSMRAFPKGWKRSPKCLFIFDDGQDGFHHTLRVQVVRVYDEGILGRLQRSKLTVGIDVITVQEQFEHILQAHIPT